MTDTPGPDPQLVATPRGPVQCIDRGEGPPVLFVHGSPGGCDQGALMTRFLVERGHRVVTPSRPGYLETPLDDTNATPRAQADLAIALMDALSIDRFALACWSGGGPSSYSLAAAHPERVTHLVGVAAVSGPFTFEHTGEERMLMTRFGRWLVSVMVDHTQREVVKQLVGEEGDLTKDQARHLTSEIFDDPVKRQWALDLMESISGKRKHGFDNDARQFPQLDLDLGAVSAPALLLHAQTDADVPYDQSVHAHEHLPSAELVTIETGTHVSVWTDADSDALQERIAAFLAAS